MFAKGKYPQRIGGFKKPSEAYGFIGEHNLKGASVGFNEKEKMFVEIPAKKERHYEVDEPYVTEIALYAENDADIYKQSTQAWIKNFARKMKKGTYDHEKGLQAIADYLVPRALEKYNKDFGSQKKFNPLERKKTAEEIIDSIEEQAQYEAKK